MNTLYDKSTFNQTRIELDKYIVFRQIIVETGMKNSELITIDNRNMNTINKEYNDLRSKEREAYG